jgi:RNA polymerase sigma-70 factor (ECF subfamily)
MQAQISTEEFNELYKEWTPKLRSYAKRILYNQEIVEDCVQEVFRKLLQQDFEKIKDHVQSWMFTVCRNTSFKIKAKQKLFVDAFEEEEALCEDYDPFESLDRKELYNKVQKIIKTLSKQQKKILQLRYNSDLSYEEIAKKLKTTSGNVGFHLSTAIKNVRKKLLNSI